LTIQGDQLDGKGRFEQDFLAAHSADRVLYPSIVDVPSAGCWRLTVRNGRQVVRFAVVAVAP
jgi:hypothetical protein